MTPNWWHRTGRRSLPRGFILAGALATGWYANGATRAESSAMGPAAGSGATPDYFSSRTVAGGQRIFRFDTFGNEPFWTDTLHLNEVVETAVDPTTALQVGLKVDATVLPPGLLQKVDLESPATTVALLKLNAIVGVMAEVDAKNHITRLGITCALCHSTVDNSVRPGIGRRQDGWPNRDLNVGAIIALSPVLSADQKAVYNPWGPGRYDPRFNLADPRLGIDIRRAPARVGPKLAALRAYYDRIRGLKLTAQQRRDLVEYLKSR